MLPIERITLTNFRLTAEFSLPLDPRLTVLHGPNAGGKTTLIDALAIGAGAILSRIPSVQGRDLSADDLRVYSERPLFDVYTPTTSTHARVRLDASNGVSWDRTRRRDAAVRVDPGLGVQKLHAWLDPLITAAQAGDTVTLPLVVYYGTDRAVPHLVQRMRGFGREFTRFTAYDKALNPEIEWKQVFEWFHYYEDVERREREKLRDWDHRLPLLEEVRTAVNQAVPQCSNPRTEVKPTRFVVDFRRTPDTVAEPVPMRRMSHGFRTHTALVIDLARRMALANPHVPVTQCPALVLIDELDLHLHPRWQQTVLPAMLNAFPAVQFVVSTHSDQIISSVDRRHIRSLWLSPDGSLTWSQPLFAEGATAEEVQTEIMHVPERAPDSAVTRMLADYEALVASGDGEDPEAIELRRQLDDKLPGRPVLRRADLEMKRQKLVGSRKVGL